MRTLSLVLAGSVLPIMLGAAMADDGPDYGPFGVGTYLSYTDNPAASGPIDRVPHLSIAFGDGPQHKAQMDTGSTGLVVSADQVPSLDGGVACNGCITYSSSGRILTGVWVTTPVTITGGNQASVTTKPMPVLAVTSITTCTGHPRTCTREDNPTGVDLIGVGFAREYDHMPDSTPDKNPFLNIDTASDAPSRRGYVVTRLGVHVGLTRKNTQGDFHFVKLAPDKTGIEGEWQPAPVCITVATASPVCGNALVDTGVTSMFLTVPSDAVSGVTDGDGLAAGTHLAFTFPDSQGTTIASYGIDVGGTDALTPPTIRLNTVRRPFVNTSVRLLNGFDILYDADGGYFAFRPRP